MRPTPASRVLVIEDSPTQGTVLLDILQELGRPARLARTIAEARRAQADDPASLVFLDVRLPDGSGLDLCREWKTGDPEVVIALLTVLDSPDDVLRGLEAGADLYVPKPVDLGEISIVLAELDSLGGGEAARSPAPESAARFLRSALEHSARARRRAEEVGEDLHRSERRIEDLRAELQARRSIALRDRLASVGRFAAGVTHQVNNPLSWILDHLQALEAFLGGDDPLESATRADLATRVREALRGAERIQEAMRALALVVRSGDSETTGPVDLAAAVREAVDLTRVVLTGRGELVLELRDGAWIRAQRGRLVYLVACLLMGLAEDPPAPGTPGPTLRIDVQASGDAGVLTVRDSGPVLGPETHADELSRSVLPGSGREHARDLARHLLASWGGELHAEDLGRAGTHLELHFRAEAPPAAAPGPARPRRDPAPGSRPRLLVVDDEPAMLALLARGLRGAFDLETAESAAEAIELLERSPRFDLVLSDVVLHGESGLEILRWLRAQEPPLPTGILLMSGGGIGPSLQREIDEAGLQVVWKPFPLGDLRERIDQALDSAPPGPAQPDSISSG